VVRPVDVAARAHVRQNECGSSAGAGEVAGDHLVRLTAGRHIDGRVERAGRRSVQEDRDAAVAEVGDGEIEATRTGEIPDRDAGGIGAGGRVVNALLEGAGRPGRVHDDVGVPRIQRSTLVGGGCDQQIRHTIPDVRYRDGIRNRDDDR